MHLVLWLGFGAAIGLGVVVLLLDNYLDHLVYYDYDYDSYLAAHRTYNIAIALDALLLYADLVYSLSLRLYDLLTKVQGRPLYPLCWCLCGHGSTQCVTFCLHC